MSFLFILPVITVTALDCLSKQSYPGTNSTYPFELPALPYDASFISTYLPLRIVNTHYWSHTKTYAAKLNSFISLNLKYNETLLADLVDGSASSLNLQKFAGGLYNHYFYFWTLTAPECSTGAPVGDLLDDIKTTWGNFSNFQTAFNTAASGTFGSGWVWLCRAKTGLQIKSLAYQRNPLYLTGSNKCYPVLGIDLWEHAYYFKYMASRDKYVQEFWNAVDWEVVEQFYDYFAKDLNPVLF